MPTSRRFNVLSYVYAIGAIIIIVILKRMLISPLDSDTPFLLFYGTIAVTTWIGGALPGTLAAFVSAMISLFFFYPPYDSFELVEPGVLFRLSLFFFEATVIMYIIAQLRTRASVETSPPKPTTVSGIPDDALLLNMLQITAPLGIGFWDTNLRYVRINPVMASLSGLSPGAHIGRTADEVLPNLGASINQTLKKVLETGAPVLNQEISQARRSVFGESRQYFLISYYRLRDDNGRVYGVGALMVDITERKNAEEEKSLLIESLNQQRDRLDFLARASNILASSLDYETTLRTIAQIAVPTIADWCSVDILQQDGRIERLAVTHVDPKKVEWAHELNRKYPPNPDDPRGAYQIIRSGEPQFYPEISDELLIATIEDPEVLGIIRELGLRSAMNLPLTARGRGVGMLQLVMAESGRNYTQEDFKLGQELASRAAIAIDNARLYREATQVR